MSNFLKNATGDYITKDPLGVLDYTINWASFLSADTIATSVWTVPTGLIGATPSNTTTTTMTWLSGGTAGVEYTVSNKITTAGGRTEKRSFKVVCKEL